MTDASKPVKAHRSREASGSGGYPIEKAQVEARQGFRCPPLSRPWQATANYQQNSSAWRLQ